MIGGNDHYGVSTGRRYDAKLVQGLGREVI